MSTSTYTVTGMTCGHCVASVTEEISEIDGVREVAVDLPTGLVTVTSDGPVDPADVRAAVEEAGYQLAADCPTGSSRRTYRHERSRAARRLRCGARPAHRRGLRGRCGGRPAGRGRRRHRRPRSSAPGTGTDHAAPAAAGPLPAGLASSAHGYTLVPTDPMLTVGRPDRLQVPDHRPDGAPVTAFDEEHTKRLHLIVVRRDTTGFQHLHPEMAADGTWRVPLTLPAAGSYRAFADFTPTGGPPLTLGVDLAAAGDQTPVRHQPARTAQLDGYTVQLDGELVPGAALAAHPDRDRTDGEPVTDLQPYLGAYGHLVALREGDLAYLHVHPDGAPGDGRTAAGPQIRFVAEVPSAATYRLFLDFQHGDAVRTAEFTLPTGPVAMPRRERPRTAERTAATDDRHRRSARRAAGRAGDRRHDLRVLREPDRAHAQQARRGAAPRSTTPPRRPPCAPRPASTRPSWSPRSRRPATRPRCRAPPSTPEPAPSRTRRARCAGGCSGRPCSRCR